MSAELAVETASLTKRFGKRAAVDGLDLAVPRGSVFGFLGPNGSGKTTTIRMLLGLVTPTAGTVRLLGSPMPSSASTVLPRVSALIEGPGFAPYLSGTANLARLDSADRSARRAGRADRISSAIARVGLEQAAGKAVKAYSLGMKQRLGIAGALLRPPELLVLDEPTNGLDPQGTREIRSLVASLAGEGTTVLISSHLLAEVQQICSHIGVMRAGRLVAQGSLDELVTGTTPRIRVDTPDPDAAAAILAAHGANGIETAGAAVTAEAPHDLVAEALVRALVEADVRVRGFALQRETLEDRFVELTGEGFDVDG